MLYGGVDGKGGYVSGFAVAGEVGDKNVVMF